MCATFTHYPSSVSWLASRRSTKGHRDPVSSAQQHPDAQRHPDAEPSVPLPGRRCRLRQLPRVCPSLLSLSGSDRSKSPLARSPGAGWRSRWQPPPPHRRKGWQKRGVHRSGWPDSGSSGSGLWCGKGTLWPWGRGTVTAGHRPGRTQERARGGGPRKVSEETGRQGAPGEITAPLWTEAERPGRVGSSRKWGCHGPARSLVSGVRDPGSGGGAQVRWDVSAGRDLGVEMSGREAEQGGLGAPHARAGVGDTLTSPPPPRSCRATSPSPPPWPT